MRIPFEPFAITIGAMIVVFVLYKLRLVSKEAYEGKETKNIRIAKYIILIVVITSLVLFAGFIIFSYLAV